METHHRIKCIREYINVTRNEMSAHLNITNQALAQKENGDRGFSLPEIQKIADLLNIHPIYLSFYECQSEQELIDAIDSPPVTIQSAHQLYPTTKEEEQCQNQRATSQ